MLKDNKGQFLDLKQVGGAIYSTEDRILGTLMREKGATKAELSKITGIAYPAIRNTIIKMEDKGFVVGRRQDDTVYFYLTMAGAYEAEDRLNGENVDKCIAYFITKGASYVNTIKFLKNRFYKFYIAGEWNSEDLVKQYIEWCNSNNIECEIESSAKRTLSL